MNAGVSTMPDDVWSRPARAAPSRATISKRSRSGSALTGPEAYAACSVLLLLGGAVDRRCADLDAMRLALLGLRDAHLEHATPPGPGTPPPLHLVGDRSVGEREHLKAAGIGDDRPLPAHEAMEPAEPGDPVGPRSQHQMKGVPEHQLDPEPRHLGSRERPDAAAGRERD